MQTRAKWLRFSGIFFFSISTLFGAVLFGLINWAALEAYFYFGYGAPADKPLTTLKCPLIMTAAETGSVTISYTNLSDRTASPDVRTDISYLDLVRSDLSQPSFAPGETRKLRWKVTSSDVVFGNLIMAQVNIARYSTLPSREGTCGILFVNLGRLKGGQALGIALAIWLASVLLGWGLWLRGTRHVQGRIHNATVVMILLTAAVLVGMLAGDKGLWGLGIACLVLVVLLSVAVVGYFIQAG